MNNSYSIFFDLREATGEITLEEKWWEILKTAKIIKEKECVSYYTTDEKEEKVYEAYVFLMFLLCVMKIVYFTDKQLFQKMLDFSESLMDVVAEDYYSLFATEEYYRIFEELLEEMRHYVKKLHV